jgi:hypothetical protein
MDNKTPDTICRIMVTGSTEAQLDEFNYCVCLFCEVVATDNKTVLYKLDKRHLKLVLAVAKQLNVTVQKRDAHGWPVVVQGSAGSWTPPPEPSPFVIETSSLRGRAATFCQGESQWTSRKSLR